MPVIDAKRCPVTRDRTNAFKRHRVQQCRRRQDSQQHSSTGPSQSLLAAASSSDPECPVRGGQASLPPQWVDFADKAKEDIKDIRGQLVQLKKAQQRRLSRTGSVGDAPDQEVEEISSSIAAQIRVCEQAIFQVRSCGVNHGERSLDDESKQNTQRSLAAQLQQLAKQSRELQRDYMQEVKRRRMQQQQAGQPMVDLEEGGQGGSQAAPGQQGPSRIQLDELAGMEEFAATRSSEVAQIAASIEEMNRLFRELAVMVIDQGSILDRIDYNTEKIYKKADDGRRQMEKSVTHKRKADSRTMCLFIGLASADAVALLVLLVKWQIQFGLMNVVIFISVVALLGAGGWFGWKHLQPLLCPAFTLEKAVPDWMDPSKLWRRIRPGPVNMASAAAKNSGIGGGLNAVRHVWRPPGR